MQRLRVNVGVLLKVVVVNTLGSCGRTLSDWHLVRWRVIFQVRKQVLLYAAACGSEPLVETLLDEFNVPMDAMVAPAVCLDCDPVCLKLACTAKHGVGMETALMSAALSGQEAMVRWLCRRGVDVNAQNEVREFVTPIPGPYHALHL